MAAPTGHCHLKRRRIEAVITGRTRNAFALRGTRVRIPPSPLASADLAEAFFCEFQAIQAAYGLTEKYIV